MNPGPRFQCRTCKKYCKAAEKAVKCEDCEKRFHASCVNLGPIELQKIESARVLGQLKRESLKKRRKDSRLILLYKGLKGKARIPTDDLIPKNRRCRNQHSLAFQIPSASKEAYKSSFFPQTNRDWNDVPDSLSPLLKCLMTVCPSSLHLWVQGTNFSPIRTPW